MPNHTRKKMHVWLRSNQEVRIGFAQRSQSLVLFTKEALIFLLQVNAINIDQNGNLISVLKKSNLKLEQSNEEIIDCYHKAEILGHWFSRSGSPSTIYTMWGVKP